MMINEKQVFFQEIFGKEVVRCCFHPGYLVPGQESTSHEGAILRGFETISSWSKVIGNRSKDGKKGRRCAHLAPLPVFVICSGKKQMSAKETMEQAKDQSHFPLLATKFVPPQLSLPLVHRE